MQETDSETRVSQAECVKDLMYTCANYPTHLDSSVPMTTPPPLTLPIEQTEQLVATLTMCATGSIYRRMEALKSVAVKEDADELGE